MTFIELLVIVLCLAGGVIGAAVAGARFGAVGYFLGFAAGASAFPVLLKAAIYVDRRFFLGPRTYPACICGRSGADLAPEQNAHHILVMRCQCGEAFIRRHGRIFRVGPEAALFPHVRWHATRGWAP